MSLITIKRESLEEWITDITTFGSQHIKTIIDSMVADSSKVEDPDQWRAKCIKMQNEGTKFEMQADNGPWLSAKKWGYDKFGFGLGKDQYRVKENTEYRYVALFNVGRWIQSRESTSNESKENFLSRIKSQNYSRASKVKKIKITSK